MNSTVKNKEKLQNTKKIKDIVKRFSILFLSLILLLSSFCLSFADSLSFDNIPYSSTTLSRSDLVSSGLSLNTGNGKYTYISCTSSPDFYVGAVQEGRYIYFYALAKSNDNLFTYQYCFSFNSTDPQTGGGNSLSSSNGVYYYMITSTDRDYSNIGMTIYNSINELTSVFSSFTPTQPIRYPFSLQNGYLFVFDCGQSNTMYSFDLSSKSEEYSDFGSIPFPDTNQSYWFSDSLPEIDETTIPNSSATIISWQKADKTNIFGQTQDMITNISGTSTGRYLYIYNPPVHYKWSGSSNPTASETINYPMIINGVSENENWYIYDSVARLTDFNQGGSVTGTVTGENIIGSVSSDGAISLVTSSGAIYTQNSGGSTDISGANGGSIAENISGLKQTLDDFVNQFIQLLSAPISHIQQLIQSSHQFFDIFSQLFEWLPSELSSVIVSGLIIMVVIGVIKMLL